MRKVLSMSLAAVMALSLAGCGGGKNTTTVEETIKEETTKATETQIEGCVVRLLICPPALQFG